MTESGQTHSLVLTPTEKLSGQNLEIEEASRSFDLLLLTRQPELLIRQKKEPKAFRRTHHHSQRASKTSLHPK